MKRPFLVVSILALILSFAALYLGEMWVLIFSLLAVTLFLIMFFKNRTLFIKNVVPIIFLAMAVLNAFSFLKTVKTAEKSPKDLLTVKGVIIENPIIYENGQSFILRLNSIDCKAFVFSSKEHDLKAGDKVVVSLKSNPITKTNKPSNYSKGIYVSGFLQGINEIKRPKFSAYRLVSDYRNYIEKTILNKASSKNAPVLIALTTGNKRYIDPLIQESINSVGVSHIMSVSGLHLGIICLSLVKILKKFKVNEKIIALSGIFSILFVITACGFQISAIRSAVAYLILFVGMLINRKGDALNSLCAAVTLIIIANPFIIGSVSFLLSVVSTFGILVLYPMLQTLLGGIRIKGYFGELLNRALKVALVSFSAIICSMPILVYYFGTISTVAILVNVLVLFAANTALVLTVVGLIFSVVPLINILSVVLFFSAEIFTEYFMAIVKFFGSTDFSVIYVGKEMSLFWLVFAVAVIVFSYLGCKKISQTQKE